MPWRTDEPIDVMVDVVNGFERYMHRAERVEYGSVRYRANLLWVHALAAMTMGPLFAAIGHEGMSAASFAVLRQIPGTPLSLGVLIGAGGLVLGLGCVFDSRRIEVAGLLLLSAFYLTLAVGFGAAVLSYVFDPHHGPIPPSYYAPVLYLHMSIIMGVHMATLIRARLIAPKGT